MSKKDILAAWWFSFLCATEIHVTYSKIQGDWIKFLFFFKAQRYKSHYSKLTLSKGSLRGAYA